VARKRHQQDAARIGAVDDQVRYPMGQRIGLAGSGAGDDQQRPKGARPRCAMLDGAPLFWIETVGYAAAGCTGSSVLVKKSNSVVPVAVTTASALFGAKSSLRNRIGTMTLTC
jgi:hypothetical protein